MYEYKKRTRKIKKVFLILLLMVFVSIASIFVYNMYVNIDIYSTEESSSVIRLSETIKEDENQDITDILDKTIKCVVGISKIKNTGNSIFLNNSTNQLGLGTGMIVTENRIYSYKLTCSRK